MYFRNKLLQEGGGGGGVQSQILKKKLDQNIFSRKHYANS